MTTTDVPPPQVAPRYRRDDAFATIINMNRLGELTAELGFIPADAAAIGESPYGRRLVLSRIPACRLGIRVQRDDPAAEELALIYGAKGLDAEEAERVAMTIMKEAAAVLVCLIGRGVGALTGVQLGGA
jgi:hypothetical protein